MKKEIITILVIIILIAILVTIYVLSQNNSGAEENNSNIVSNVEASDNTEITNEINNAENALGTENKKKKSHK